MKLFNKICLSLVWLSLANCQIIKPAALITQEREQLTQSWLEAGLNGNIDIVRALIGVVDINVHDKNGNAALLLAAFYGHENIVKLLLEQRSINVNFKNKAGITALMFACIKGHENIVKLLLARPGINVNARSIAEDTSLISDKWETFITHKTALIFAAQNGHENIVKLLLAVPEIDINAYDGLCDTAIKRAASNGHENIVKLFLNIKSIVLKPENGCSAFFRAVQGNHPTIVKLFLQHHTFNVNDEEHPGTLQHAAWNGFEISAKMLIDAGVNIYYKNAGRYSALMHAAQQNHESIVTLIKDKMKKDAYIAIQRHDLERLKTIIEYGGEDIVDWDGSTLLDKAFEAQSPEIIFYLLQKAQDPQQLLARIPFEHANPTSDLFKFFLGLAYGETSPFIQNTDGIKVLETQQKLKKADVKCQICDKEASLLCSKCKKIYYCSSACQKAGWKSHKSICVKI